MSRNHGCVPRAWQHFSHLNCRCVSGDFHDQFNVKMPNSMTVLMRLLVDGLLASFILGTPFTSFVEMIGVKCFQAWTM